MSWSPALCPSGVAPCINRPLPAIPWNDPHGIRERISGQPCMVTGRQAQTADLSRSPASWLQWASRWPRQDVPPSPESCLCCLPLVMGRGHHLPETQGTGAWRAVWLKIRAPDSPGTSAAPGPRTHNHTGSTANQLPMKSQMWPVDPGPYWLTCQEYWP